MEPQSAGATAASSREDDIDVDGHRWHSPHYVSDWIRRYELAASPAYQAQHTRRLEAIVRGIPHDRAAAITILDIGSGWGRLARQLLGAFPNSRLLALDFSRPMREEAGRRLAAFAGRVEYADGDLAWQGVLQNLGRRFDVVVSSSTLHHVPELRLQSLCREAYAVLEPGGVFINLDRVRRHSVTLLQAARRFTGQGPITRALAALQAKMGGGGDRATHGATHGGYRRMMRNAGFRVDSERVEGFVLMVGTKVGGG